MHTREAAATATIMDAELARIERAVGDLLAYPGAARYLGPAVLAIVRRVPDLVREVRQHRASTSSLDDLCHRQLDPARTAMGPADHQVMRLTEGAPIRAYWQAIVEGEPSAAGIFPGQICHVYSGHGGLYRVVYRGGGGAGWCIYRERLDDAYLVEPVYGDEWTARKAAERLAIEGRYPSTAETTGDRIALPAPPSDAAIDMPDPEEDER